MNQRTYICKIDEIGINTCTLRPGKPEDGRPSTSDHLHHPVLFLDLQHPQQNMASILRLLSHPLCVLIFD